MTPLLLFSLLLGLNLCPHVFSAVSGGGDNGAECLPDNICNDVNAICDQSFTCSCKQGYSDVEGLCRKIEGVLGRPCNGTADCFDRNSICFQSTCQCAQGFSPEGQICISSDGSPPPPPPTTETPPPTAPPTPPTALPPNSTAPPLPSTTFSEEQTPPIGPPPTETPPPTAPPTPPTALPPNATAPPPLPSTTFSEEQTPPIGPPPTESPPPTASPTSSPALPPNATAPPTVPATAPPTPTPSTNYTEEQTPPIGPPTAPPTETPPPTAPPTATPATTPPPTSSTALPPTVPPQTDLPPTEAPLTTAYPPTQTGTTYPTTDFSTTSYGCFPECANFGSCVTDEATGADKCLCPLEFTGLYCETPVDVCIKNQCPPESTCKPDTTSTNGHICVCVGDFTGQDCSKVDPLVTCRDIDKILHLDIKPVPDDRRRICFPKRDTTTTNICYDETENLIYETGIVDDTRLKVDDLRDSYCISYIADDATEPRFCTQVTAYEGDDFSIRPWRHANATLCFLFNRKPNLTAPFEVRYNIPNMAASETVQLASRDPDTHQTITFQILGTEPEGFLDLFSVDATGLLETKKPTFELPDPFDIDLKIRLEDNGIPVLSTDRVFKVKFTNRELFCTSKENPIYVHTNIAEFPLEIGQINCQTDNPTLSFSVSGDSDLAGYFKVEQDGSIFLNPGLLEGTYDLTVKAEVTQPVRIVTNVPITIILGNMIPDCSVVLDTFSMPEDEVIGSCSEIIKTCSNPSGRLVQCSDDSDLFNVRCTTLDDISIEMKFCSGASLRNMVGSVTITTIISNTFGDALVKQEAIVENVNDRPVLVKLAYNFTIDEAYTIGELVTSIIVTDQDQFLSIQPPESLTVEITAPANNPAGEDPVYPFIASLSDAGDKVEVTVSQLLDADTNASQRYKFLVQVTDSGGLSDSVLVTVYVADVNDESPICDPQQYDKTVSVKDQPGKIVATLKCTDRDYSPEFNTLSYSLDSDLTIITDHFTVDSNSGVVQLTKSLTDLTTSSLSFVITVSDGAGLSSQVKVNVDISSDYPPECDAAVLTTRKSENMENTCFTIPSKCTEPVDSLPLQYEIDTTGNRGNGTQYFRLDVKEIQDDMIGICTIGSLKNRYGTWVLYIRAISDFGSTPITIHISVSDQNDPPEFVNAPYSVSVKENTLVGTQLITLSANDPDSGAFGQVTFISEGDLGLSASQIFKLDGTTGIIRVQGNLDADISTSTVYTFIVKAIDEGPAHDPPVTTNVTISIIDVNDNAPECDAPTSADPINLLTPPGTHVYNLSCTDNDKSPQFRQLSYEIISQSTPDVFSISRDGSIVLERPLSRDITKYTLEIAVHDSSDNRNRNTQTVDIVLNVNNGIAEPRPAEVPPECSPALISQTVSERKPVNFCIQEVRCIDKTGGGQLELISTTGDGMEYLEIKIRKEEQQLLLSACIKASLEGQFGTYQIKGNVSNGLAEVNVLWNITVKNENDYPSFGKQLFEETIPEDSDPGLILKLDLSDPDDATSEKRFHIVNVTAVSQNDHNNASSVSNSISFFSEVRSFYLSVPNLNATLRNVYRYKVTAVDGGGLKATTTAVIYISDVNESPICEPREVASSITILAEVGDEVASLSCFDTDRDLRNRELQYRIASGDVDNYFSVSTDSTIIVAKKLPRTNLYNTGTANLEVIVEDRGIPILSTSVNVQITIDNSIPPECNPVLTPPDKWLQGACLTITMNCIDPSLPDSPSLLSYDPSGNYSSGFNISDPLRDAFRLCYRLIDDGYFQIKVRVDNGLSVFQYSEVIVVKYEEATPVFTNSSFRAVVPEFTTANTEILRARATSSNQIGDLVYSIIGAESDDGWSVYFEIDTNTGMITSLKTLRDLADTNMRLKVEVKDTGSKLKSSAQVEITVEDINEPPVCDLQSGDVNLDVDTDIGHIVMQFQCSDPDIVPTNKQLSYTLKGQPNVQVYFKLMPDNDPTSIVLQELLPVYITAYDDTRGNSKGSYQVDFEVSDSGQPPLIYSVQLNIIVSLLPPAVVLKIQELSYSHVFVTWEYLRGEYNQITNYFQVKIREPGGSFVTTERLTSSANSYNVTDIKSETEFELFVSAETPYGTRDSEVSTVTTLAIPQISRITVALKYQELEFSSLLRNPNSQYYRATTNRVRASVDFPLKGTPGYAGNSVFQYSPGSVIAVIFLSVNQSGNTSTTRDLLAQSVQSGYLGELAVDSTYFYANVGGGLVIVETIAIRNENVYNGTDITIACAISTMGYGSSAEFIFWWTFNDIPIRPTIVSRLSTSSFTNTTFPELYTSVLNIEAVTPRDTGLYGCYAADAEEQSSSSKTINMEVLSQPIVSLIPRSLTANSGDTVTVTCTLTGPLDLPAEFVWYRNDSLLESKEGEVYSSNETAGTITIASMTVTTIFGCRGRNEAGLGPLVQSYIGVIPRGPEIELCPEITDSRGTEWPASLPGATAVKKCPPGYTGSIKRICDGNSRWKPPKYNCVQDTITEIQKEINSVKDGSSRGQIRKSLEGLNNATDTEELYEGDIRTCIDTLDDTAVASESTGQGSDDVALQIEEIDNYLKVCSNLIGEINKQSWESSIENDGYGAIEVSRVVEKYIKTKSEQLSAKINEPFERDFNQQNIYAKIGRETGKSLTFPDRGGAVPAWVENSGSQIYIPEESLGGLTGDIISNGAYLRNLSSIVTMPLKRNGIIEDVSKSYAFNTEIIYYKVQGLTGKVDPPLTVSFKPFDVNFSRPICVYWDFAENAWSEDGCYLADFSSSLITCKCNHLTNFAVLMSPGPAPEADILALSIISAVGCAISLFCLVITIVLHGMLWRIVKSDRAVLLLNLCVALIIGYAVFLGGVGQADNKDLCTAIAVLLHYIFLAVFFLMLAEGVEIAVSIMYVFATKSRVKFLVPLAWFIPAVIVGISAGVTKLEGYGNDTFCWLSTESGLFWAFVGPAAFVILVNFIIIVIVFRQMFTSSAMLTKSDKQKAKTSLRSLCVLLPIMGLTWVFGVFSVNESLVAFQYIFAICNSLQGFFIFLFHCLLNKQLQDALKQRRARKKSLQSFEKSYKNQHSTGTSSTGYPSLDDKSKQFNNEQSIVPSSNPFLEADRQMKEMVGKGKKTGNTFDRDANNKKEKIDKDKPPVDVALEDVKISNILRESEVMGGTTGISSILTNSQTDTDVHTAKEELPVDDNSKMRASKASTHGYDYILDSSYRTSAGIEKPAGYEKLLGPATKSTRYDRIVRSDETVSGYYDYARDTGSGSQDRTESRQREDSRGRSSTGRSDNDYEQRLREGQDRIQTVYMPYDPSTQSSQEEVGASMPKKYDPNQTKRVTEIQIPKKGVVASNKPKVAASGAVKKLSSKKKKEMERSKIYQYPYDQTYLGPQSRHSSLENMTVHYVNPEYSPYAGMQPQGYTGRPTHQPRQWNPYGWGNQQRRDYW